MVCLWIYMYIHIDIQCRGVLHQLQLAAPDELSIVSLLFGIIASVSLVCCPPRTRPAPAGLPPAGGWMAGSWSGRREGVPAVLEVSDVAY